ncbi:hypothetical protein [Paenarthrobacter sp. 22069]|uniref:hypothetical protein n=1 Tax=Paenarthrobacter sp. 22069 TaxID=3453864 RepID=UPI003F84052E
MFGKGFPKLNEFVRSVSDLAAGALSGLSPRQVAISGVTPREPQYVTIQKAA